MTIKKEDPWARVWGEGGLPAAGPILKLLTQLNPASPGRWDADRAEQEAGAEDFR